MKECIQRGQHIHFDVLIMHHLMLLSAEGFLFTHPTTLVMDLKRDAPRNDDGGYDIPDYALFRIGE